MNQLKQLLEIMEEELKKLPESEALTALMDKLKIECEKELDDKQIQSVVALLERYEELIDVELFMKK